MLARRVAIGRIECDEDSAIELDPVVCMHDPRVSAHDQLLLALPGKEFRVSLADRARNEIVRHEIGVEAEAVDRVAAVTR